MMLLCDKRNVKHKRKGKKSIFFSLSHLKSLNASCLTMLFIPFLSFFFYRFCISNWLDSACEVWKNWENEGFSLCFMIIFDSTTTLSIFRIKLSIYFAIFSSFLRNNELKMFVVSASFALPNNSWQVNIVVIWRASQRLGNIFRWWLVRK